MMYSNDSSLRDGSYMVRMMERADAFAEALFPGVLGWETSEVQLLNRIRLIDLDDGVPS